MTGRPVRIEFLPRLTSRKGKLESNSGKGVEVHGASFLRARRVVLEQELLERPHELSRILAHELFHFVWLRAGNPARHSFERLIAEEIQRGARGELGWSAEWRKSRLSRADRRDRTRAWREYVCESFCDSAAWLVNGTSRHPEYKLADRFQQARREWFGIFLGSRIISI